MSQAGNGAKKSRCLIAITLRSDSSFTKLIGVLVKIVNLIAVTLGLFSFRNKKSLAINQTVRKKLLFNTPLLFLWNTERQDGRSD